MFQNTPTAPGPIAGTTRAYVSTLLLVLALVSSTCTGPTTVQPEAPLIEPEATLTTKPTTGRGVGDTLHILSPDAPTTLNPHLTRFTVDGELCRITYEPLASFDIDGHLVPILAAEIPTLENGGVADDYKSVTWKLEQDVRWSDGEPFTANDVLFTYEFITNTVVNATSYDAVASVEIIDSHTIKVNFTDANPAWAVPFVGLVGSIIPRHIFEICNNANASECSAAILPVGTGPYRMMPPGIKPQEVLLLGTRLVRTNKIVFEPNPYFREADKPFFSQIEFRGGGTVNEAARLVLQAGTVDFAYDLGKLPPKELAKLEAAGQGQIVTIFGGRVNRITLNRTDPDQETPDHERSSLQFDHPFFDDKKVRQAFAHAIDRKALAPLFGQAGRSTINNLVAPPQYNSPNTFYEFDLEKARTRLEEADWTDSDDNGVRDKNGVEMRVIFQSPSTFSQQYRQIVQDALEDIGVEVRIKITPPSIMFGSPLANPDCVRRFNSDVQTFSWRNRSPDPSGYMQYWTCDQIPQQANNWEGGNYERWCNPGYDALYRQSATELDPEKRRQLFIQMNDMQIEDVAMIPVVWLADAAHGVSWTIEDIVLTPWDTSTWNIKDWRRISE